MTRGRLRFTLDLVERSVKEFVDDRGPQFAASVAFHVLFSLFPLAIALASFFGVVVGAGVRADVIDAIVRAIPASAQGDDHLRRVLEGATTARSALGVFAIVALLWTASGMMAALRTALNAAWDVDRPRPFLKQKLVDLGLVCATAPGALVLFGTTIATRSVAGDAPWLGSALTAWTAGVAIPAVYLSAGVFLLYRLIPACDVAARDAWAPSVAVACALVAGQNLFALYVEHFADYNAVYGSLGAVVAFMFFVYLSAMLLLLGAELAAETPRLREAHAQGDVEEGPPLREQVRGLVSGLWSR